MLGPHPTHTCPALEVFSHRKINPLSQYHTWSSQEFRLKDKQDDFILPYDYRYIRFYGKVWEWEGGVCPPEKFACGVFEGAKVGAQLVEGAADLEVEKKRKAPRGFVDRVPETTVIGSESARRDIRGAEWSVSRCYTAAGGLGEEKEEEVCAFVPKGLEETRFGKVVEVDGRDDSGWVHRFSVVTSRSVMIEFAKLERLMSLPRGNSGGPVAYNVVDIPGKEKGAVAGRLIRRGEEVMSAAPLVMVDDVAVKGLGRKELGVLVNEAVQGLESEVGRYYRGLAGGNVEATGERRGMQVFAKNAFKVRVNVGGESGGERVFHTVFDEGLLGTSALTMIKWPRTGS